MRRLVALLLPVAAVACANSSPTDATALALAQGPPGVDQSPVLTGDVTWPKGTLAVPQTITVTDGTLTVVAGTTLQMARGTSINVQAGGAIRLVGSEAEPVRVTSSDQPAAAGNWGSILIDGSAAAGSELTWATVEFGGAQAGALVLAEGATARVSHCTFQNAAAFGADLQGRNDLAGWQGNRFVNNALGPIRVTGEQVDGLPADTYTPNAVEGVYVVSSTLGRDATWKPLGVRFRLEALTLATPQGTAKLTVAAGTTVAMTAGATPGSVTVGQNAALILAGEVGHPTTVTSDAAVPGRGNWRQISITNASLAQASSFANAVVEYGGGSVGDAGMVQVDAGASLALQNATLQQSASLGLSLDEGGQLDDRGGNSFVHSQGYGIRVYANVVTSLAANTYGPNDTAGIQVAGAPIVQSAAWPAREVPYAVSGTIVADHPTTQVVLSLAAGSHFVMLPGSGLVVGINGAVRASGTAAAPIAFDAVSATQAWDAIELHGTGNVLTNVAFNYGSVGGPVRLYGGAVLKWGALTSHGVTSACVFSRQADSVSFDPALDPTANAALICQ